MSDAFSPGAPACGTAGGRTSCAPCMPWMLAACATLVAACGPTGSNGTGAAGGDQPAAAAPVELPVPAGANSGQAHLAASPDGAVVLSWLEPAEDGFALRFAVLDGDGWGTPRTVASGDNFVVNWADFPSVVPITEDVWAAHWLTSVPDSFASYDIAYAVSTDGGQSFVDHGLLNADGVLTEHGFVSLFGWADGIGAIWLDGRQLAALFESGEFDLEGPPVGMSLRFARFGYDGRVVARGEIDELACDCCQTDAVLTGDGPLIVYRDRTPDEIRDNVVRAYRDGEWTEPVVLGPDGWRIEGCPVNGPAVAARGGDVVAAWFTAPDSNPRVRAARSRDGGATFGAAVDVDGAGSFGHVGIELTDGGDAIVSWWRRGEPGAIELAVRRVRADGSLGEPRVVAANAVAQPLDVPQMALAGDSVVLAWTDAVDNRVRTVQAPLP